MPFPRRSKPLPARSPHPDPLVEGRLQRILALQERITTKDGQIRDYTTEIGELLKQNRDINRTTAKRPQWWEEHQTLITGNDKRVRSLQEEIRQLEADIDQTHAQITKQEAELEPTELAWLYGSN